MANQDLLFKSKDKAVGHSHAQQWLEGRPGPRVRAGLKAVLGQQLGVQEHRSSAQVSSQQTGTQSMLQHRAQAHPLLSLPLLPPQLPGFVFSFPVGTIITKKAGAAGMSPLRGGGAFRSSPDGSCAQQQTQGFAKTFFQACVNEPMCAPGQLQAGQAQVKPGPVQGLLLHHALLPGGQK